MAFPEKSDAEREAIARDMWENLGRIAAEGMMLDRILDEPDRVAMPDATFMTRFSQRDLSRGCVLVSLHLGNWELVAISAGRAGLKTAGVYRPMRNPLVEALVVKLRTPLYPAGLHSQGHGTTIARKMLNLVRSGGTMAVLGDLYDERGTEVSFFGHPSLASTFPAMVARTLNVPLVVAGLVRTEGVHFQTLAEFVDVPVTDDRQADVVQTTVNIHRVFERWIRQNPEQWFWIHPKWGDAATLDALVAEAAT